MAWWRREEARLAVVLAHHAVQCKLGNDLGRAAAHLVITQEHAEQQRARPAGVLYGHGDAYTLWPGEEPRFTMVAGSSRVS